MMEAAAFTDLRNYIKTRITSAEYKVGDTWTACTIAEAVITGTGIVRIKCQIAPGAACTILGVRIKNADGQVWCTKDVNVVIDSASTHLLQWFDFVITESEVS